MTGTSPPVRVSTLELFFDLVFVFSITQLTTVLVDDPTFRGAARAVVELGVLWWMYGGYAWLTNAVPPRSTRIRLLLMVGMAGFLVMALAIPDAFGDSGVAFGVGYLVVTLVHTIGFLTTNERPTMHAILRVAPFNLLSACVVLGAGFVTGAADWVLWTGVFTLLWVTPWLARIGGFTIVASHFVERHGLVVIIVLGESIVAVGVGARGQRIGPALALAALLGLALVAALWWLYFDGDDERAEVALTVAPADRRTWLSLLSFGYCFVPMLAGVVALSAGVKLAIAHLDGHASWAGTTFLAGGVALYVGAEAALRAVLQMAAAGPRFVVAALALGTIVAGRLVSAELQMAALLALLIALLIAERRVGDNAPSGALA